MHRDKLKSVWLRAQQHCVSERVRSTLILMQIVTEEKAFIL